MHYARSLLLLSLGVLLFACGRGDDPEARARALVRKFEDQNRQFVRRTAACPDWAREPSFRGLRIIVTDLDRLRTQKEIVDMGEPAVGPITELLRRGTETDRFLATCMLGEMGGKASASLPALETALEDKSTSVQLSASISLWLITGNPAKSTDKLRDLMLSDDENIGRAVLRRIDDVICLKDLSAEDAVPLLKEAVEQPHLSARARYLLRDYRSEGLLKETIAEDHSPSDDSGEEDLTAGGQGDR